MSPSGAGTATLPSLAACARFARGALRALVTAAGVRGARARLGAGARERGPNAQLVSARAEASAGCGRVAGPCCLHRPGTLPGVPPPVGAECGTARLTAGRFP